MSERKGRRRVAGGVLLIFGFVCLLIAAGWLGAQQLRARAFQARLAASLAAQPSGAPILSTVTPGRSLPTEMPMLDPEPSPSPFATAQEVPSSTAAPSPVPTPLTVAMAIEALAPERPVPAVSPGPPVRIVISDLGIDVPVVEMGWRAVETADGLQSEWVIPPDEAGHHVNSAIPGETGNVVISGHNNVYGRVFEPISQAWDNDARIRVDAVRDRSDVLNGRSIQLFAASGGRFDYVIQEFYRLRDTGVSTEQRIANARFMQPTEDSRLTLVTCWPPWNNTHRLVVVARPAVQPP